MSALIPFTGRQDRPELAWPLIICFTLRAIGRVRDPVNEVIEVLRKVRAADRAIAIDVA